MGRAYLHGVKLDEGEVAIVVDVHVRDELVALEARGEPHPVVDDVGKVAGQLRLLDPDGKAADVQPPGVPRLAIGSLARGHIHCHCKVRVFGGHWLGDSGRESSSRGRCGDGGCNVFGRRRLIPEIGLRRAPLSPEIPSGLRSRHLRRRSFPGCRGLGRAKADRAAHW